MIDSVENIETETHRQKHSTKDFLKWDAKKRKQLVIDDIIAKENYYTQGEFSSALKKANILDNKAVNLPGNLVLLPYGVKLIKLFSKYIEAAFEKYNMQEYSYPVTAPLDIFEAEKNFFSLQNKLLYIASDSELEQSTPRGVLCPTGEATIYTHWSKEVKNISDLPIKMYRRTSYFRPFSSGKHAGRGVFRSLEAGDVFEFHSCFSEKSQALLTIEEYFKMLREISNQLYVPTLWTIRPPWTNNESLFEWSIGGDVPLPTGNTVQTTTLYNQGEVFSRAYNITFKNANKQYYTQQVTGCVTRRLILAHLMLGIDVEGNLFIHPDLSPTQISIIFKKYNVVNDHPIYKFKDIVSAKYRVESVFTDDKKTILKNRKKNKIQGVPLEIFIQDKRHSTDKYKIILTRSDTLEEAILYVDCMEDVLNSISPVIKQIGTTFEQKMDKFYKNQLLELNNIEQINSEKNKVKIFPLLFNKECCLKVESLFKGEILGFTEMDSEENCILTGEKTSYKAIFSRRI
ncbi:aminoacyl--tRNA ligase-related protein [Bacillus sp. N6]|uniref:aminoacyl--tRNA ligase-related protein n=1 Tax=Bacillus sp. N6 TaxID=127893 RepID=UPI004055FDDB